MRKPKTRFGQVPLDLVRKVAKEEPGSSPSPGVVCAICGNPVDLECCKIDEDGDAVHDKCYLAKMSLVKGS
jgi:hypothetical protein